MTNRYVYLKPTKAVLFAAYPAISYSVNSSNTAEPGYRRTLNTWPFPLCVYIALGTVHIDNGRHCTLGHDRRKVRTGWESHSQTLGVRVWMRETRVGILLYFLAVSYRSSAFNYLPVIFNYSHWTLVALAMHSW